MSDYWMRWKQQADAIAQIFVDFGQKIHDVDSSWSLISDVPGKTLEKKLIVDERNLILKAQREAYVLQEDTINTTE